jgi:hypothetical protein
VIKRGVLFLTCLVLLAAGVPAYAQQTTGRYFPDTRHNVVGEFYLYYQNVPEAELVFGSPITEQFVDRSGRTVQYFQRARFELWPEMPVGQRVQLTPLGSLLYTPGAPSLSVNVAGACRTFPTGFSVCYDFLTFYDAHGGAALFGNPISAFEFQPDGRILQYFERARFEWYPERPRGQNVSLSDLGRIYFDTIREDPLWLRPTEPLAIVAPAARSAITSLRASAFVWKAVTLPSDTQRVFVVVQDQTLTPVEGAQVTVTVNFSYGPARTYRAVTDANGVAVIPDIEFQDQVYGSLIEVSVRVEKSGLVATTTTSFRIWR